MLNIPIILGTNRQGRQSEKVAKTIEFYIKENNLCETHIIDVRDFDLPNDDYGPSLKEKFPAFVGAVEKADGFIIVSPEYNHSFSGSLKSLMDICYDEYNNKAVGIVGVSQGAFGGARAIESVQTYLKALGLKMTKKDLAVTNVAEELNEKFSGRVQDFLDELLPLAKALQVLRS
jgi:NAD(P)H-dependent FMN reductase